MARVTAWFAAASRKFLSASMDRLGLVVLLRLSAGALGVVIDGNRGSGLLEVIPSCSASRTMARSF